MFYGKYESENIYTDTIFAIFKRMVSFKTNCVCKKICVKGKVRPG